MLCEARLQVFRKRKAHQKYAQHVLQDRSFNNHFLGGGGVRLQVRLKGVYVINEEHWSSGAEHLEGLHVRLNLSEESELKRVSKQNDNMNNMLSQSHTTESQPVQQVTGSTMCDSHKKHQLRFTQADWKLKLCTQNLCEDSKNPREGAHRKCSFEHGFFWSMPSSA